MIQPLGRKPSYSGKFRARVIELYCRGVQPGYMSWDELQSKLEEEFPEEFKIKGDDKPDPKTVLGWVKKYCDAPVVLRELGVIKPSANEQNMSLAIPDNIDSFINIPMNILADLWLNFLIQLCCYNIMRLTMASCINDPQFNN